MSLRRGKRKGRTINGWLSLLGQAPEAGKFVRLLEAARRCPDFSPDKELLLVRAPGRCSDFGNHIDLKGCGGPLCGTATDEEIISAIQPRDDGVVVLNNMDAGFPRRTFSIKKILPSRRIVHQVSAWDEWTGRSFRHRARCRKVPEEGNWDEYVKGLVIFLQDYYRRDDLTYLKELRGFTALISSNLSFSGGKSSSSALVVNLALGLDALSDFSDIPTDAFIDIVGLSEWYVMTRGGCADHARLIYSRRGHLVMVGSFPTRLLGAAPIPKNLARVIINCGVDRPQDDKTRNVLRVTAACFPLAVLYIKHFFPEYKKVLEENDRFYGIGVLREFTSTGKLGRRVTLLSLYDCILRLLPVKVSRARIIKTLPEYKNELKTIFSNHLPPPGGYELRDAALFGLSEIERCLKFFASCKSGDIALIMRLTRLSHDGDRVARHIKDREGRLKQVGWHYPLTDGLLDKLVERTKKNPASDDVQLYNQPGSFHRSIPEMDAVADLVAARFGENEAAVRIMGAGKGGDLEAFVHRDRLSDFLEFIKRLGLQAVTLQGSGDGASLVRLQKV